MCMVFMICLTLPRRCLHGVHLVCCLFLGYGYSLCLGAACTECIFISDILDGLDKIPLPRRCLHGVHPLAEF